MQNEIVTAAEKTPRLPRYTVRRETSINSIGQILIEQLALFFPQRDVDVYGQWQAGTPISRLTTMFNLSSNTIRRIVKQIDQRIETCFEIHRIKALLEMVPIYCFSDSRTSDYITQIDEALIKVTTLRVDSIVINRMKLAQNAPVQKQQPIVRQYLGPGLPVQERLVRELKFSARTTNILAGSHITTIGQLCKLSVRDLSTMRGVGTAVINEVQIALSSIGLSLRSGATA